MEVTLYPFEVFPLVVIFLLIFVYHFLDIDGFNQIHQRPSTDFNTVFSSPLLPDWILYQYIMYTCMSYEISLPYMFAWWYYKHHINIDPPVRISVTSDELK